ncbi:MAG: DUF2608 domain-containing protein, partial [Holosporaceae bacterium]|nr:DUF2608 domain-containing protein [Holosporaceae bacterium]
VIPEFLGVLSEKKIAYFCLTATLSCIWPEKREDLDIAGLDKLFCRNSVANTPFSRIWKRDLDDSKKYYWDFEYSTMYSVRANPAESKVSEENPLARVNLYQVRDWIKTSKGKVFQSAVEDEIITKPDVMVFIDDRIDNVKDVRLACEQLRINYLGIVCNF